MSTLNRRDFLYAASAAAFASATGSMLSAVALQATPGAAGTRRRRVFVGSNAPDGILAFDWDPVRGELIPAGVAAKVPKVAWLDSSHEHQFLYAALEVDEFNGKPTGGVVSFRVDSSEGGGTLHPLSSQNSAGTGTCHVAVDHTGRMLVAADYSGGSAASLKINDGKLSKAVWSETYTDHGPNPDRQEKAHAHFASFSPDNRFAYMNDLGGDCIHIYKPDTATAAMSPAGVYKAAPGSGPRTLHFHPNGHTAYCMNEIVSTVDVLEWNKADGSLSLTRRVDLLPEGYTGPSTGCDTVISQNGRFVYFANRFDDFLFAFKSDWKTGNLTPMKRSSCGGKVPRNFVLDPSEKWMLVANQASNLLCVFARDPETGTLAEECKSYPAQAPMRILFT